MNWQNETTSRAGIFLSDLKPRCTDPLATALFTVKLAHYLGVSFNSNLNDQILPYDDENDALVFQAPLCSLVAGRNMNFLRGWKQYGSCIKGFNGLGLLAEHLQFEYQKIQELSINDRINNIKEFLQSRMIFNSDTKKAFEQSELSTIPDDQLLSIDLMAVSIWNAYASRTIVCSTSSNMGISLHEALRYMQAKECRFAGKTFSCLNRTEGRLIIWCPDDRADFMNKEKTAFLKEIAAELPTLTSLTTYINRKQRDPGALTDALVSGGYFFPTNPQSPEEMHNLLTIAFNDLEKERNLSLPFLLRDPKIRLCLESIGAEVSNNAIKVRSGIEGGLYGLMVPYIIALEELLSRSSFKAMSTWNQASIGAALAAAVLCDQILRSVESISSSTKKELQHWFPKTASAVMTRQIGKVIPTRIHGVFDIANLQSLAQLFGVVIDTHLSGRGTAYVGLGSSSYANGNRCYEILRDNVTTKGAFNGKETLHPATHTLNPVAQALIFAEDLMRAAFCTKFSDISHDQKVAFIAKHARKPEPAGAAAMAGYLLTRIDQKTLSAAEIAFPLKLAGFKMSSFLEFCKFEGQIPTYNSFIQEAKEEGDAMGAFAIEFLRLLDRPLNEVATLASKLRTNNRLDYFWSPLDPGKFEYYDPNINIYLTGDNCAQPPALLIKELLEHVLERKEEILSLLSSDKTTRKKINQLNIIRIIKGFSTSFNNTVNFISNTLNRFINSTIRLNINNYLAPQIAESELNTHKEIRSNLHSEILDRFKTSSEDLFIHEVSTNRSFTYKQFYNLALKVAQLLKDNKLQHSDRIAILLPNSIEFAAVYFGSILYGTTIVPINTTVSKNEFEYILDHSTCRAIITFPGISQENKDICSNRELTILNLYIASRPDSYSISDNVIDLDSDELQPLSNPFTNSSTDDLISILYTSGTTGTPKGIANRISASFENARAYNQLMNFNASNRFLHLWPMSYSTGLLNTLVSPFMAGASIVLAKPFEPSSVLDFWKCIIANNINTLWLSPTMVASLLKLDRDPNGLAYCKEHIKSISIGTAPLPTRLRNEFEKKYSKPLFESYGLSELLIITGNSPLNPIKDGSVGKLINNVHVKILSESGSELGFGEEGEIYIKTPYIMAGYLNKFTSSVELASRDDWFATGDLGYQDTDGYLFITGRKKDLIIRGGYNISPKTVEEVLYLHPKVEQAVVIGIEDNFYGEQVIAALKLTPNTLISSIQSELINLCRKELNSGSIPSEFIQVESYPLNKNGKILRHELKQLVISKRNQAPNVIGN